MEHAQLCVAYSALVIGTLCFVVYAVDAMGSVWAKLKSAGASQQAANSVPREALQDGQRGLSITDFSGLVEALAKLSDSLAKAGPAVTSLIGAVLFYAIAAVASGALHDPPEPPKLRADVHPSAPAPSPVHEGGATIATNKSTPPSSR